MIDEIERSGRPKMRVALFSPSEQETKDKMGRQEVKGRVYIIN